MQMHMDAVAMPVNPPDAIDEAELPVPKYRKQPHAKGQVGRGEAEKRLDASGKSAVRFHYSEIVEVPAVRRPPAKHRRVNPQTMAAVAEVASRCFKVCPLTNPSVSAISWSSTSAILATTYNIIAAANAMRSARGAR
ncbi:hypothetical protein [Bradyrhizobium elkanii]|uniref:hypothetical protein n=1 Tax=Bradyrhizobium elkanii TaxID=29448 RepID=UPI0035191B7F